MKVLVTGLPHFAPRIARFLSAETNGSARFVPIDTATRRGRLRFFLELPTADTVLRYWGTVSESRALELALRLGKHVVQFWAGTDVLWAQEAFGAGAVSQPFVHECIHLCESPWTRDELAELGVSADVVPLSPTEDAVPADAIRDPQTFRVLAYVGQDREEFYRLPDLVRLAGELPEVRFSVTGLAATDALLPSNLELLGWLDDPTPLYRACATLVRLPVHDGYSFSVREALTWGRHVVSSYPYPHCRHAPDYETLRSHVVALKTSFDRGELRANREGREFVLREFEPGTVARQLVRYLEPPR